MAPLNFALRATQEGQDGYFPGSRPPTAFLGLLKPEIGGIGGQP